MAGSVNKVILIGHLGADPEIRRSQAGNPIATFRLATSETWRDKQSGERREKTEWHNVVVFNEGLTKIVEQYVKKGSKIYVEGSLATRKWQDQNGNDRYSTEIVLKAFDGTITLLDRAEGSGYRPGGNSPDDYGTPSSRSTSSRASDSPGDFSRDMNDDIPF
jgi:single-strand DNA-binding protein